MSGPVEMEASEGSAGASPAEAAAEGPGVTQIAGVAAYAPEQRMLMVQFLTARQSEVAAEWSYSLLKQSGLTYMCAEERGAEMQTREEVVLTTQANSANILGAITVYLQTGNTLRLRKVITEWARTRMRQGFGPDELLAALFLFRSAVMRVAGTVSPEAHQLIDAVTFVCARLLSRTAYGTRDGGEGGHDDSAAVEDVRPPSALFMVQERTEQGGISSTLWRRSARETMGKFTFPPGQEPLLGAVLAQRYRVRSYVANGSFGHGWLAFDAATETEVFLKTFRAEHDPSDPGSAGSTASAGVSTDLHTVKEMAAEISLMRQLHRDRLSHPGLVQVLDVTPRDAPRECKLPSGVSGPLHYSVNVLCRGGDIYECFCTHPPRPFPEQIAAYLMRQLFEAMTYLHSRFFFHRDIKCENILVSADTEGHVQIKLTDFGRMVHCPPSPNEHGRQPAYLWQQFELPLLTAAPEACKGGHIGARRLARPDGLYDVAKADIFSAGCFLVFLTGVGHLNSIGTQVYECLKAVPPSFTHVADGAVEPYDRLRALVPPPVWAVSDELEDILREMLATDPASRPPPAALLNHPFTKRGEECSHARVFEEFHGRRPAGGARNVYTVKTTSVVRAHVFEQVERALSNLPGVSRSDMDIDAVELRATVHVDTIIVRAHVENGPNGKVAVSLAWFSGTDAAKFISAFCGLTSALANLNMLPE